MAATSEIAAQLDAIDDSMDPGQLERLEEVLAALRPETCGGAEFSALLSVLERFPLDDGFEAFWSIVHFLERCEGYEPYLVASVSRQPAELSLGMVNRLLNAGFTHCGNLSYLSILERAATDMRISPELRARAADLLARQRGRGSDV